MRFETAFASTGSMTQFAKFWYMNLGQTMTCTVCGSQGQGWQQNHNRLSITTNRGINNLATFCWRFFLGQEALQACTQMISYIESAYAGRVIFMPTVSTKAAGSGVAGYSKAYIPPYRSKYVNNMNLEVYNTQMLPTLGYLDPQGLAGGFRSRVCSMLCAHSFVALFAYIPSCRYGPP